MSIIQKSIYTNIWNKKKSISNNFQAYYIDWLCVHKYSKSNNTKKNIKLRSKTVKTILKGMWECLTFNTASNKLKKRFQFCLVDKIWRLSILFFCSSHISQPVTWDVHRDFLDVVVVRWATALIFFSLFFILLFFNFLI